MSDPDRIKVGVKVRPLISREKAQNCPIHWRATGPDSIAQVDPATGRSKGEPYIFDHVFGPDSSNREVFEVLVRPIVEAAVKGFNGTIFAYGQTASGKTYTMMGDQYEPGIIPQAVDLVFNTIENTHGREFLLRVCYMEIYNERVNDLLLKSNHNLKVSEDTQGNVFVKDLEETVTTSSQMVMDLMRRGENIRKIGVTNMNERSSRSHSIFRLIIESRQSGSDADEAIQVSHLNLVDLAGSERAGATGALGDLFKEGCAINKSLFTLGKVISQLSDGDASFVNFRDSKLTRILQSSLGGNALTSIICAITPAALEETSSTLGFASRARNIKNTAQVNEVLSDSALLKRYVKQIDRLNSALSTLEQQKSAEHTHLQNENALLQERISRLKESLIGSSSDFEPSDKAHDKMKKLRRRTWSAPNRNVSRLSLAFPQINKRTESVTDMTGISCDQRLFSVKSDDDTNESDVFSTPLEEFERALIQAERAKSLDTGGWSPSIDTLDDALCKSTEDDLDYLPCNYVQTRRRKGHLTRMDEPNSVLETPPSKLREKIVHVDEEYKELREFTMLEKQIYNEELSSELQKVKDERQVLISQNEELGRDLLKVKEELKAASSECEALKDVKQQWENMKLTDRTAHDYQMLLMDCTKQISQLKAENSDIRQKLSDALSQCKNMEKLKKQHDSDEKELLSTQQRLKRQDELLRCLQNDKDDFDIKLEMTVSKYEMRLKELSQALEDARQQPRQQRQMFMRDLYSLEEEPSIDDLVHQVQILEEQNKELQSSKGLFVSELAIKQEKISELENKLQALLESKTFHELQLENKLQALLESKTLHEQLQSNAPDEDHTSSLTQQFDSLGKNHFMLQQSHSIIDMEVNVLKTKICELGKEIEEKNAAIARQSSELERCSQLEEEFNSCRRLLWSELEGVDIDESEPLHSLIKQSLSFLSDFKAKFVELENQARLSAVEAQENYSQAVIQFEKNMEEMKNANNYLVVELNSKNNVLKETESEVRHLKTEVERLMNTLTDEICEKCLKLEEKISVAHKMLCVKLKIEEAGESIPLDSLVSKLIDSYQESECNDQQYNGEDKNLEYVWKHLAFMIGAGDRDTSHEDLVLCIEHKMKELASKSDMVDTLQVKVQQLETENRELATKFTKTEQGPRIRRSISTVQDVPADLIPTEEEKLKKETLNNKSSIENLKAENHQKAEYIAKLESNLNELLEKVKKLQSNKSSSYVDNSCRCQERFEKVQHMLRKLIDTEDNHESLEQMIDVIELKLINLSSKNKEIGQLQMKVNQLTDKNSDLNSKLIELQDETSKLQESLLVMKDDAVQASGDLLLAEEHSKKLMQENANLISIVARLDVDKTLKDTITEREDSAIQAPQNISLNEEESVKLMDEEHSEKLMTEILNYKSSIENLKAEINQKAEYITKLESNLNEVKSNIPYGKEDISCNCQEQFEKVQHMLRKLIVSDDNNDSLEQMIASIDSKLTDLSRKNNEIEQFQIYFKQLTTENLELNSKLSELQDEATQARHSLRLAEGQLKGVMEENEDFTAQFLKLKHETQRLTEVLSVMERKAIETSQSLLSAEEKSQKLLEENMDLLTKVRHLEEDIKKLNEAMSIGKDEVAVEDHSLQLAEENLKTIREKNEDLTSQVAELQQGNQKLNETLLALEQKAFQASQCLLTAEEDSKQLVKENARLDEKVTQLQEEILRLKESIREGNECTYENSHLVNEETMQVMEENKDLTLKVAKLENQALQHSQLAGEELRRVQEKNEGLTSQVAELQQETQKLHESLLVKEEEAIRTSQSLSTAEETLKNLMEEKVELAALVGQLRDETLRLKELISSGEEESSRKLQLVIDDLKRIREENVALSCKVAQLQEDSLRLKESLSLEKDKAHQNLELAEEESIRLKKEKFDLLSEIDQLHQETLRLKESLSVSEDAATQGRLAEEELRRVLEKNEGLTSQVAELQQETQNLHESLLVKEEEAIRTSQSLSTAEETLKNLMEEKVELAALVGQLQDETLRLKEVISSGEEESSRKLQLAIDDLKRIREENVSLSSKVALQQEQIASLEESVGVMKASAIQSSEILSLSEEKSSKFEKEVLNGKAIIDDLMQKMSEKIELIAKLETNLAEMHVKVQAQSTQIAAKESLRTKASSLYNDLTESKELVNKLESELLATKSMLKKKDEAMDLLSKSLEDLQENKCNLEAQLRNVKAEKDLALRNLASKSNMAPDEEVNQLRATNESLLKSSNELRNQYRKLQSQFKELKQKQTDSEKSTPEISVGQLLEERRALLNQVEELEKEVYQLSRSKSNQSQVFKMKREASDARQAKADLELLKETIKEKEQKFTIELSSKSHEISNLLRAIKEKEEKINLLETELGQCHKCAEKDNKIAEIEEEKIQLDKECEHLLSWGNHLNEENKEYAETFAKLLKDLFETKSKLFHVTMEKILSMISCSKDVITSLNKVAAEQLEMQLSSKEKSARNAKTRADSIVSAITEIFNKMPDLHQVQALCSDLHEENLNILKVDEELTALILDKEKQKHCGGSKDLLEWGKQLEAKAVQKHNAAKDNLNIRAARQFESKEDLKECPKTTALHCQCEELRAMLQSQRADLADRKAEITELKMKLQIQNKPAEDTIKRLEEKLKLAKDEICNLKSKNRQILRSYEDNTVCAANVKKHAQAQTTETNDEIYRSQYWPTAPSGIIDANNKAILETKCKRLEQEKESYKKLCLQRKEKIDALQSELSQCLKENCEPNESRTYSLRSRKNT